MLLLISLSLALTAAPVQKEDDAKAVLATVQAFLDTMTTRDVEGARRVLLPEARFVAVSERDGKVTTRVQTAEAYLKDLAGRAQEYRERIWSPEVRVHGRVAAVWTPYDFWTDRKFSHCGVDAFALVQTSEGWRISSISYTVERSGCPESPLGALK